MSSSDGKRPFIDTDDLLVLLVLLASSRAAFVNLSNEFLFAATLVVLWVWMIRGAPLFMAAPVYLLVTLLWLSSHGLISNHADFVTWGGHFIRIALGICVAYAVSDPLERLVNWIVRLSVVGIVLFALGMIAPMLMNLLYGATPELLRFFGGTVVDGQLTSGWERANWLVYTYAPDRSYQNHGFMWEPAAFAMIAAVALWGRFLKGKVRFDRPNLILLVAIASTLSTTGILGLMISLFWMVMHRRGLGNALVLIALPFMSVLVAQSDLVLSKILAEFQVDLSAYNRWSLSRFQSFQLDMLELAARPVLGAGIVVETRPFEGLRLPSHNGLSDFLNRYGIVMSAYSMALLVFALRGYSAARPAAIACFVLVILIFSWSEKFFELPFFYMLVFLPPVARRSERGKLA